MCKAAGEECKRIRRVNEQLERQLVGMRERFGFDENGLPLGQVRRAC